MGKTELTDTKRCPDCNTDLLKSEFYKNKARHDGLQSVCKSCISLRNTSWYEKNRESHNKYMRNHSKEKRYLYNARDSRRIASELCATPPWADLDRIKKIYEVCRKVSKSTGVQHHVDHVLPLRGKEICGLHVENNLAIIPAAENLRKGNSFMTQPSPKDQNKDDEVD